LDISNIEPNLRIFETYERLETEEERLKRVAELKEKLELSLVVLEHSLAPILIQMLVGKSVLMELKL
jgi:hypothetical protein